VAATRECAPSYLHSRAGHRTPIPFDWCEQDGLLFVAPTLTAMHSMGQPTHMALIRSKVHVLSVMARPRTYPYSSTSCKITSSGWGFCQSLIGCALGEHAVAGELQGGGGVADLLYLTMLMHSRLSRYRRLTFNMAISSAVDDTPWSPLDLPAPSPSVPYLLYPHMHDFF
jgi:hypothetical protein